MCNQQLFSKKDRIKFYNMFFIENVWGMRVVWENYRTDFFNISTAFCPFSPKSTEKSFT